MKTIFVNTIVFVKDIERSKIFYRDLLDQKIVNDFDSIVFFENHLVLHQANKIINTVFRRNSTEAGKDQGNRNILIYFESDDLEAMFARVNEAKVPLIHGIELQDWGQKVFRFFDPDNHMVEIGEPFRTKGITGAAL